jgi:hypothetical protein
LVVDIYVEIDHAGDVGLSENGVVERVESGDHAPVAHYLGVQELAFGHAVLAAQRAFQFGKQFVHADGGQEAETAQIHRKQRDLAPADGAHGGEQGAVAAQHDHQVTAFGHVGPRKTGHTAAVECGRLVDPRGDAAIVQPLEQPRNQRDPGWRVRFGNHPDGPNDGHRGETPCSLRRRGWGYP